MKTVKNTFEEFGKQIERKFIVQHFDPSKDSKPYFTEHLLNIRSNATVLDGLTLIKEKMHHPVSVRYSCRMAICGSCGMVINNIQRLACSTKLSDLQGDEVEVKPLPNYEIIRDLVTDFGGFFEKHKKIRPHILGTSYTPSEHVNQTPQEWEEFVQYAGCIKCGLCTSACPTAATDKKYLGPQALSQAFRYMLDSRDKGDATRLGAVDTPHGIWSCHFAGSCSYVCPKGVDPAQAIQLMKRHIIRGLRK